MIMFENFIPILLFCFLVKCHNCLAGNHSEGIYRSRIGAWRTAEERYPHNVLIHRLTHKAYCGGSIVADPWVLTAAQCNSADMDIYGSTSWKLGGARYKNKNIHIHPKYNYNSGAPRYDFMLIELNTKLHLSLWIKPIPLSWSMLHVRVGKIGYLAQYGDPFEQFKFSDVFYILRELEFPIIDFSKCRDVFSKDNSTSSQVTENEDQFCAGYFEGNKGLCNEEIGGGFMVYAALVGVASRSPGCANPNSPNIYAALPAAREWICNVVGI